MKKLPRIDLENVKLHINTKHGIYFWFDKKSNLIVYIGIALGAKGLKGRIISQHLNPKYLEYRSKKHTQKDFYQILHAVKKYNEKNNEIQKGIDKSAFRKSIGRTLNLKPGDETIAYIYNNLYLRVLESEDNTYIRRMEKVLIKRYRPKFNTTHKQV